MTDRELELRLKQAVESCTPNVLDKVMAECDSYKENDKKKNKTVDISEKAEKRARGGKISKSWNRFAAMAAMLVLVIGTGIFSSVQYEMKRVVSVIQYDINPSVEVKINKKEIVVEAKGLNTDGGQILSGMTLEGLDVYTATNAIIGSLLKNGYIDELANSILLSVEDADSQRGDHLKNSLSQEINSILEGAAINVSLLTQYVDEKEANSVDSVSQEYGISHGKAALIEHILESNTSYTFEELSKLSVNELNLIVSNPKNNVKEVETTGEASKSAYISEEDAKAVAFARAKLEENEVLELEVEIDYEYGVMVYDVEFTHEEKEHEFYINAVTGEVLEYEIEYDG